MLHNKDREETLYTIGKVSELCNLPKKTLRFYDEKGLIKPDKTSDDNGYRYYTESTMYCVPPLKYFKFLGFSLEQIKCFLERPPYSVYEDAFAKKLDELLALQKKIQLIVHLIKDWNDLIIEARLVLDNKLSDVSVKYISEKEMVYMYQDYTDNAQKAILNLPFTQYIESIENVVVGAVILQYPSYQERMENRCKKMCIMQTVAFPCESEKMVTFGGGAFVSCYHIGSLENIHETYEKILRWAKKRRYVLSDEVYERHVTDYWLTQNTDLFVTEILCKIKKS